MKDPTLQSIYLPLKLTYGLVPLLAGLDKFTGFLADWPRYLSPTMAGLLPFEPATFMKIVGVIEIVVGLAVLTKFTRLGAYVAMAWLVLIALNLALAGYLDIAVRDLAMAVGAYCLGTLAGHEGLEWVPGRARVLSSHAPTLR